MIEMNTMQKWSYGMNFWEKDGFWRKTYKRKRSMNRYLVKENKENKVSHNSSFRPESAQESFRPIQMSPRPDCEGKHLNQDYCMWRSGIYLNSEALWDSYVDHE